MKQYEAVIQTIERLGGVATLGQLNQEVFKIDDCQWETKTPFASIRRIVQTRPEIYKIKIGLYGLSRMKTQNESKGILEETQKNKNSKEVIEFNHTYYQGILLQLGNFKGLNTFTPNQDKGKRFLNDTLGNIRSLETIPQFSYPDIVKKSSTIDVIWFNERKLPHSFFEVEHSTDIQNSLLKFNELRDFHVRMVIVADRVRRSEYESKIRYQSFNDIKKRTDFLDYDALIKQYESVIEQQNFSFIL